MALTQDLEGIRLLCVAREPNTLERIGYETKTCARKLARAGDVAAHVEESHGENSDLGYGCHAATRDVLTGDGLETPIRLWLPGLWDDCYDVEDLHAAADGEVFSLCNCGTDCDEEATFLGFKVHLVDDGPADGADELENAAGHGGRESECFLGPLFVVVVVSGELERFAYHAACDVSAGWLMVGDAADVSTQGGFLDRDAEFGEVGVRWELSDTSDTLIVCVDEAAITTFGVECAHAADSNTLKTDDTGHALARFEDETW
ncbi:hypothetical protein HG530_009369 [Fusarium avenaceum]|nr:hypothetical protein HG530_009369 [Fusarium avenaceum]